MDVVVYFLLLEATLSSVFSNTTGISRYLQPMVLRYIQSGFYRPYLVSLCQFNLKGVEWLIGVCAMYRSCKLVLSVTAM